MIYTRYAASSMLGRIFFYALDRERSIEMKGTKYLDEAVDINEIKSGQLNLIEAPVGSGKSHFALNVLPRGLKDKHNMVYLIDTVNGKQQLQRQDNVGDFNALWKELVENGIAYFGEEEIVVMTYAKFGTLAAEDGDFGINLELIVCDEIHNLVRFQYFGKGEGINPHMIAKKQIEKIIKRSTKTKVVALSATPKRAEKEFDIPIHKLSVDKDIRQYETKTIKEYSNIKSLLEKTAKGKIGLVYVAHIRKMQELSEYLNSKGIRAVAFWSIRNGEYPMTDEQLKARESIINNEEMPKGYEVVIINSSSETSINIRSRIDYIVINSAEEEVRIQVRGRYRGDLEELYLYDKSVLEIPQEFMDRPLFHEDKQALCRALEMRDKNGRTVGWTTVRKKLMESEDYFLNEGKRGNKRYAYISM